MRTSNTSFTSYKFENSQDLNAIIDMMPDATSVPIRMSGQNEDVPGYQAIVNGNTGLVAQIATDSYEILQHRDFFGGVVHHLDEQGIQYHGDIVEMAGGDRWKLRAIFDGVTAFEPRRGRNINVGGEFSNSYNGSSGARGRGYFMRLSCMNQFTLSNMIPEANFSRSHNAVCAELLLEQVQDRIRGFVERMFGQGAANVEQVIEAAMNTEVVFADEAEIEATFQSILGTKKHGTNVAEVLARDVPTVTVTRWDMYNAITDYTSHAPGISPDNQDRMLDIAERKILNTRVNLTPIAPELVLA